MGSTPVPGSPDPTRGTSARESAQWFSYACPVCGHRDGADLDIGSARRMGCGHCETVLELSATSSVDETKGPQRALWWTVLRG